jgi:hypothetical protein
MRFSWKLLPVAALFALGIFMISLPSGAKPASANAIFISATPIVAGTSYTVTATLTNNPAASPSTIVASGFGTFTNAPAPTVAPIGGAVAAPTGFGTNVLSIPGEQGGTVNDTVTVSATFTCNGAGAVLFTLTQGATSVNSQVTPVNCGTGAGTGAVTITGGPPVLAQGAQGSYSATASTTLVNQAITISATPALVTFGQPNSIINSLPSGDIPAGFNTTVLTITAGQVGNRTITGTFTCIQQGTFTLTINVTGGLTGYSTSIICGTGILTPTVGLASNVTVAASPTSVSCNGTAFVTVTVRNIAGGYVSDGTPVTLTTSIGSLSPTQATTLGGGVLAVFTAPGNQSGTATINAATAGTTPGTASITVACQVASPTPAVPPTIFVPPPAQQQQPIGQIAPPNTGDAGLADANGWRTYGGVAMVVVSVMAAAAVVRKRA